jgi:hypothetical protein
MRILEGIALGVFLAAGASTANSQSLANRIAAAGDRTVQFSYPTRTGVCGDGRSYISTGPGNFYGSFNSNNTDQCQPGPARVVIDVADRNVVALRTYVGPAATADASVSNLGTVTASEAADYLLGLAGRADGRVGRDAIFAALLGENVEASAKLLEIGRDRNRPLETRRAALGGLTRSDPAQLDRIGAALLQIATNDGDVQGVRSHALAVLARLDRGAGIQPLIQLASSNLNSWVGAESMKVLASSGDPRARQYLRQTVQRTDLPDELLAVAIRGLGRNYVTGQDATLLRSLYPRLTGDRSRNALLASIAELGGSDNVQWLSGIVRDDKLPADSRRRALEYLSRAGATSASLIGLYDSTPDTQLRSALIGIYSRLADKAATDKLVWIARNETDAQLKRRAISALSRNSDPVVRQALADIVER